MPSTWSQEKYNKALKFAAEAHHGQTVPGSDLPYIVHVTMVAMEVIAALAHEDDFDGDLAVQCALLHDVIEDCGISYKKLATDKKLATEFGSDVAEGVLALSKDEKVGAKGTDRYERKKLRMIECLSRINKQQKREIGLLKLADRVTNFQPPPKDWDDKQIARYREEGTLILSELSYASPYLAERLRGKLRVYPLAG